MEACCEFSRKVFIHQIQKKAVYIEIEANDEERRLLAERFFIPSISILTCKYQLGYFHGGNIRVQGTLKASLVQNCVVSLEDFPVHIHENFELLLVPASQLDGKLEELEDPDVIPYDKDFIDIGEITSQQLALLLDPYPHKPEMTEAFVMMETEDENEIMNEKKKNNPFKILKQLKNKEI